jgi:hypothetical protein
MKRNVIAAAMHLVALELKLFPTLVKSYPG